MGCISFLFQNVGQEAQAESSSHLHPFAPEGSVLLQVLTVGPTLKSEAPLSALLCSFAAQPQNISSWLIKGRKS